MHISTVNISQMVTDRASIAIANTEVAYGLSSGILTFDLGPFKGQVQGHAHFHLANCNR